MKDVAIPVGGLGGRNLPEGRRETGFAWLPLDHAALFVAVAQPGLQPSTCETKQEMDLYKILSYTSVLHSNLNGIVVHPSL